MGGVHHAGVVSVLERRTEGRSDDGEHQPSVEALKHRTERCRRLLTRRGRPGRIADDGSRRRRRRRRRRVAGREVARPREARARGERAPEIAHGPFGLWDLRYWNGPGTRVENKPGKKNCQKSRIVLPRRFINNSVWAHDDERDRTETVIIRAKTLLQYYYYHVRADNLGDFPPRLRLRVRRLQNFTTLTLTTRINAATSRTILNYYRV